MMKSQNTLKNKGLCCTLMFIAVLMLFAGTLSANAQGETAYNGYYYDKFGEACPAPNEYLPEKTVTAKELGLPVFGTVNDMASDSSGRLYILDSDKSVIYCLDKNLNYIDTVKISQNGTVLEFAGANGFTVSENGGVLKFYIADTMNERVLVADSSGKLFKIITKPDCDILTDEQKFLPIKLAVGGDDSIYVLCQHMYDGALLLNSDGEFLGFFGSNKVEVNAKLMSDQFWKKLLGEKYREKFGRYVPREYTNLVLDEKGFVYTTTLVTAQSSAQIRLLNWKSSNVLESEAFGDSDNEYGINKFIDIAALSDGLFAALDNGRGRVFIYGEDAEPVAIFGGSGAYNGLFRTPVAIEAINDNIYVYDLSKQSVTMFTPSDYGKTLLKASRMFLTGDYENSERLWNEVLRQNNACEKAYISIGRCFMEKNNYKAALSYFEKGGSNSEYSDAFEQVRKVHIRKWFPLYAFIFIAVIVLVMYLLRGKASYKDDYESDRTAFMPKLRYALFHPNKGAIPLVNAGRPAIIATGVILLSAFLISIFRYQFTGFIFNTNEPGKMDIVTMFISIAGIFSVSVAANWLVTTMSDGKGKLLEIANIAAFSLLPLLGAQIINIILSNMLVSGEAMFLNVVSFIGFGWSAILLVLGLAKIHEFTFAKNILMLVLTLLAVCIILVLLLLCFSIAKQIEMFISSVLNELKTML